MIKDRCDPEEFSFAYSNLHQSINEKKISRKRQKAFEVSTEIRFYNLRRNDRNLFANFMYILKFLGRCQSSN